MTEVLRRCLRRRVRLALSLCGGRVRPCILSVSWSCVADLLVRERVPNAIRGEHERSAQALRQVERDGA